MPARGTGEDDRQPARKRGPGGAAEGSRGRGRLAGSGTAAGPGPGRASRVGGAASSQPPGLPAARPPAAPPAAKAIFGQQIQAAERYAGLLAGPAVARGLIGPHEVPRLWERHLLNSAVAASLVPRPCSLVDLGSGAGLPGIVMAMLLPDCEVTLLEPMLRRVTFLEECVDVLGLANARVCRGRAEDMAGRLAADVVTARAVAPLHRLAALALGLLRPGGLVLAIKGTRAAEEVAAARDALHALGVCESEVVVAGSDRVGHAATVVRLSTRR